MLLRDKMVAQGDRLFRKRGTYASVLGIPMVLLAFHQFLDSGRACFWGWGGVAVCFAVSLAGLAVRAYTIGCRARRTSGRNGQKGQVADALNTTGLYSVTRNPLYLGNFLAALGIVMLFSLWWLVIIYVFGFWLYYERIILAEENFLLDKFGEDYIKWAKVTPAFLPAIRNWRPPEIPFSWKTALKSEYQTVTLMIGAFILLQIFRHGHPLYAFASVRIWVYLLALILAFFVTVRLVCKQTDLLRVSGR